MVFLHASFEDLRNWQHSGYSRYSGDSRLLFLFYFIFFFDSFGGFNCSGTLFLH